MALISTSSRQALVEIATILQIQVVQNGATLVEGESISADVAADGRSIAINAVIRGGQFLDDSGNPVFSVASAPTPAQFPI